MSEYVISDEQIMCERRQAYEAGKQNREVWTARDYHGEEIVRCLDCKKCNIGWCVHFNNIVKPDGFCAWGERWGDE